MINNIKSLKYFLLFIIIHFLNTNIIFSIKREKIITIEETISEYQSYYKIKHNFKFDDILKIVEEYLQTNTKILTQNEKRCIKTELQEIIYSDSITKKKYSKKHVLDLAQQLINFFETASSESSLSEEISLEDKPPKLLLKKKCKTCYF